MQQKNCIRESKISIITGLKGQGKTVLAKTLMLNYDMPIIIIDRQMQFDKGAKFYHTDDLWNEVVKNEDEFFNTKPVFILQTDEEDEEELFTAIYSDLQNPRRRSPRPLLLVLDEVDDYFKNNQPSYMEKIVKFSRNRSINIIATLKRPQGIHKILETQTDETFYFRSSNNLDVDKCKKTYGDEISEKLNTLGRLQFLRVQNRAGADGNYVYSIEQIPERIFEVI